MSTPITLNIAKLFASELNLFYLFNIRHKETKNNSFAHHMCLKHGWTSPEYDEYWKIFMAWLNEPDING